jgi:TonB-dependent receptor
MLLAGTVELVPATIRGRIKEADSNTFIPGAEVTLLETGATVFSERGGGFRFTGIGLGAYTVRARAIGFPVVYQSVTISYVDEDIFLQLDLGGVDVVDLAEFVVTAELLGQAKAMSLQRSADNLLNVVSSDAFGEFVDRNAAEAMQRVVGVTVQDSEGEGKFVIIRGAAPGLSTVSIDGVQVATPEEGGRSTGLNLIAIEQLESIEVTKSWLPSQPPNFVGGAVNLITRSALDREGQFMALDVGYGRYTIEDLWSHKLSAVYGNVWGGDAVKFAYQVTFNRSMDRRGSETATVGSWYGRVNVDLIGSPEGFRAVDLGYDDRAIERERTGISTKLELQITSRHTFELSASFNRFNDDNVLQSLYVAADKAIHNYYGQRLYNNTTAAALGHDLNDQAVQARLSGADRRLTIVEGIQLGDIAFDYDREVWTYSIWHGSGYREAESSLVQDEILTLKFGGRHQLSDNLDLDYQVHMSKADKNDHRQRMNMDADIGLDSAVELRGNATVFTPRLSHAVNPSHFRITNTDGYFDDNYLYSDDKRKGGECNIHYKWTAAGLLQKTEAGIFYDDRAKSFRRDYNRFSNMSIAGRPNPQITLADPIFYGGDNTDFMSDVGFYNFGPAFSISGVRAFIDDPTSFNVTPLQTPDNITLAVTDALLRNYAATETIQSAYLMHTVDFRKFRLIAGVRYEATDNTFTNNDILTRGEHLPVTFLQPNRWKQIIERLGLDSFIRSVTTDRDYYHWLGALHGIYRHNDNLVLRGAVTQTIARPDYDDLVPREIVSVSGGLYGSSVRLPNPDLRPLESLNFDLSGEYYFKGFGYVSLGLFYKDIDGPIYTELSGYETWDGGIGDLLTQKYNSNPAGPSNPSGQTVSWSTTRRVNAGKGKLYGLEFAYEQKFASLPGPLSGLGVSLNFALMDSSVRLPTVVSGSTQGTLVDRSGEKVPLFLQPDRLANLSVFWDKYGFLVRVSAIFRGSYMDATALSGARVEELVTTGRPLNSFDIYYDDTLRLDLYVRYRISRTLSVYFEGTNLNSEPQKSYRGASWRMHAIRYTEPVYFMGIKFNY